MIDTDECYKALKDNLPFPRDVHINTFSLVVLHFGFWCVILTEKQVLLILLSPCK